MAKRNTEKRGSLDVSDDDDVPLRRRSKGKSYFLGIGIDAYEYKHQFAPLNNAVRDVKAIAKLLYEKYEFAVIKTLYDQDATSDNILNALDTLIEKLSESEKLLIYFSGHGSKKDNSNHAFWAPVNAKLNSPTSLISNAQVLERLRDFRGRHILLVSDSCHAGSFLGKGSLFQVEISHERALNLEFGHSRWGLFSGREDQTVSDGFKHSPFAEAFLDALQQQKDSFILSSIFIELVAETAKKLAPKQDVVSGPIDGLSKNDGQFIFWKRALGKVWPPKTVPPGLPPETTFRPLPEYPIDPYLLQTIPLITLENLIDMENALRLTCKLMLQDLEIPLHVDKWVLRDFCATKMQATVEILDAIKSLKAELGDYQLHSGALFEKVIKLKGKFSSKLNAKSFQFLDQANSIDLSRSINNPLGDLSFQFGECEEIVRKAFEENLEQKNNLNDRLTDISIQLQLLYLVLQSITAATDQNEFPAHMFN
ncbi:MAG: hypothetical protein DHS20C18_13960 [Saprospiraceae bacterium]|nr:MAG: hypothetical protein DHS20C18_13960 [Saprospiraceae bacterium]